jgi:hypothetical protein
MCLDVPASLSEYGPTTYNDLRFNKNNIMQLRDLVLRTPANVALQPLFDAIGNECLNLETMKLIRFCGSWIEKGDTFHLLIPRCSLKELTIDIMPVRIKTEEYTRQDRLMKDFFVLAVTY